MEVERLQETMTLKVHFQSLSPSLSLSFTSFGVTSFGVTCLKVTCWTAPPKQCILARSALECIVLKMSCFLCKPSSMLGVYYLISKTRSREQGVGISFLRRFNVTLKSLHHIRLKNDYSTI